MRKNRVYSLIYISLFLIPLGIFIRDFFEMNDIFNVDYVELMKLFNVTLLQSILTVIATFIVAIIPAYYLAYSKGKLVSLIESSIFIPFFFPTISAVVAFTIIFNSRYIVNLGLMESLLGIVIVNSFYNTPIMIKYIGEGLKKIPREIIEAGKLEGSNEVNIFLKIKLPLIKVDIAKGIFLVFIYSFLSFGIVLSIGGLKYSNLEVELARTIMEEANFSKALVIGIYQFFFVVIINYLLEYIKGYELNGEVERKDLNIFYKIVTIIYLLLEYGVVLLGIVYGFFNFYLGKISLAPLIKLFSKSFNEEYPVIESIKNSFILAGVLPIFVIIFVYLILRNYSKISNFLIVSTLGFSNAFLGILLIYMNILYNLKLEILLYIGYFLITVPIGYSFIYSYIVYFPKEINELIKLDNISRIKAFLKIEFPLLKNIFLAVYFQLFAIILGEFTIAYTMQLGDIYPIISLVNYSLYSNKLFLESGALSSLNVILVMGLYLISNVILKNIVPKNKTI